MNATALPAVGSFSALGVQDSFSLTLTALGYTVPTPIQMQSIPPLLAGRDMLGQAATGTGKTAAFGLPLLHQIAGVSTEPNKTLALVLAPTRELAMQVATALERYGAKANTRVLAIYGGQSYEPQLKALKRGTHVVVATPGRALDHIRRGTLDLSNVKMIVLDEADEMLDMGFQEDLEAILSATKKTRQTALFSATMPKRIMAIAAKHLTNPVHVALGDVQRTDEVPLVEQTAYVVRRGDKTRALLRVLEAEAPPSTMIFCRTRDDVDALAEGLKEGGRKAEAIHGGLSQAQRDRVMKKFRDRQIDTLIATDVAARGLDIKHVSHVVNFDIPEAAEAYVHRIGRTGRAGREGKAILFVEPGQVRRLRDIERLTKQRIKQAELPSVHELQKKKNERLAQSIGEVITAGALDYPTIDMLAAKFELRDIAAAALKLAAGARTGVASGVASTAPAIAGPAANNDVAVLPRVEKETEKAPSAMAKLYVSVGREANVKAKDLVTLLTRECGVAAHNVGKIDVFDRHSVVEVPESMSEEVIQAGRRAQVCNQRIKMRPFR